MTKHIENKIACYYDFHLTRAVARSGKSGVPRGSRPFAGAWGRPLVSFSPAPAGRKETLQQPCYTDSAAEITFPMCVKIFFMVLLTKEKF